MTCESTEPLPSHGIVVSPTVCVTLSRKSALEEELLGGWADPVLKQCLKEADKKGMAFQMGMTERSV